MAIYRCEVKAVSRSKGESSCAKAAYRSGTVIYDAFASKNHDYSRKRDVGHTQLFGWSGDREQLWNEAELVDTRKNACTAKEYQPAIPVELSMAEQIRLAEEYSKWLSERFEVAVDLAVHDLGGKQPHAHIMTTTRKTLGNKLGDKIAREWSDKKRKAEGLPPRKADLLEAREKWAELANQYLDKDNQIDHRSLKDQAIDRQPQPKVGARAWHLEKRTGKKAPIYQHYEAHLEIEKSKPSVKHYTFKSKNGFSGAEIATEFVNQFDKLMFEEYQLNQSKKTYSFKSEENKATLIAHEKGFMNRLLDGVKKVGKDIIKSMVERRESIEKSKPKPKLRKR
jgi:hypothetical protein